jgi:glycosyltransferase involved in cell wall biosynthesis
VSDAPTTLEVLHSSGEPGSCPAAVVVSLHDYADRILETLDTVAAQTCEPLELVVVDDASSDEGPRLVRRWMEEQAGRFRRCLLLRHLRNAGLAATRNSGFAAASSPWIWVQDADNPIGPRAVAQCLRLAERADPRVAVVHPLLLTIPAGASPQVFQGEGRPWQRSAFVWANCVDAMALVRRSAWEAVGGYVHIPDGWEDYDFWCTLIEAGWHGLQCPQVLAQYRHHGASMTRRTALPRVRALERRLRERHPWLDCLGRTGSG